MALTRFGAGLLAAHLPPMTEAERRRYLDGRHDWQEARWQDHCGEPGCDMCSGYADTNARLADARRLIFEGIEHG